MWHSVQGEPKGALCCKAAIALALLSPDLDHQVNCSQAGVPGKPTLQRARAAGREVMSLGRELLGGNGIVSDFLVSALPGTASLPTTSTALPGEHQLKRCM